MRFKLALNQDTPKVLDYDQDRWAEIPDALYTNVESSLLILRGIQYRWAKLIETLEIPINGNDNTTTLPETNTTPLQPS